MDSKWQKLLDIIYNMQITYSQYTFVYLITILNLLKIIPYKSRKYTYY